MPAPAPLISYVTLKVDLPNFSARSPNSPPPPPASGVSPAAPVAAGAVGPLGFSSSPPPHAHASMEEMTTNDTTRSHRERRIPPLLTRIPAPAGTFEWVPVTRHLRRVVPAADSRSRKAHGQVPSPRKWKRIGPNTGSARQSSTVIDPERTRCYIRRRGLLVKASMPFRIGPGCERAPEEGRMIAPCGRYHLF
jgi:hypothetical protein